MLQHLSQHKVLSMLSYQLVKTASFVSSRVTLTTASLNFLAG